MSLQLVNTSTNCWAQCTSLCFLHVNPMALIQGWGSKVSFKHFGMAMDIWCESKVSSFFWWSRSKSIKPFSLRSGGRSAVDNLETAAEFFLTPDLFGNFNYSLTILCKMTTKPSNIFLGFNSHLLKEQKTLNTIPVAAGARLQLRACVEFREPFPRVDKRPGHHFCSPELLHGHCRIPGLVVSTSHSLCWGQPMPPLSLRGSREAISLSAMSPQWFPLAEQSPSSPLKPWRT